MFLEQLFHQRGKICHYPSPILEMKSIKTANEIDGLKFGFSQSDSMFRKIIRWIYQNVAKDSNITEMDINHRVNEIFQDQGAQSLSFPTITAVGKNSAIVHYTHPNPDTMVRSNDFVLIDCGAYFDCGLATDCTRTFIAGGSQSQPSNEQKHIYTIVLKAAIACFLTKFPRGTLSSYLDSITRKILYEHHLDFNHGTGHGVGINVHESPPKIRPGGNDILKPGMIFSIEPGVYIENWGGVRIENIAVIREDQTPNWFYLEILTKAPLDYNLIEWEYLNQQEINYIEYSFSKID